MMPETCTDERPGEQIFAIKAEYACQTCMFDSELVNNLHLRNGISEKKISRQKNGYLMSGVK